MHKMGSMRKGTPSKIVTGLKNNSSAANGSINHKSNQNEMIKNNVLATPKIAVIDI
jgi:hypothetical protein